MKLRTYQAGELVGIVLLLASTATQLFYLEPLKREIEWRLVAFNTQQSAIEIIVIALLALGSFLAGLGRVLEMQAARRAAGE